MKIDIMTLFPEMCESVLSESIIGRARKAEIVDIRCHNIRDFAGNKHNRVDDAPYGGGMGMVMQAEPIYKCFENICEESGEKPHLIYMSPKGRTFRQSDAVRLSKYDHIVLLCGHYEGVDQRVIDGLRENFNGECTEVGMYLAMARVAHREGYPEIGLYWEKAAHEEAEHAAKFAELLGEVITDSTKKNLEMRVDAENGATDGKFQLAKLAKQYNLDAIHDTVHEMARDEARHGKAFEGLLKRYFGE